ncbi:MAG: acetylglutamate kinase [Verrucomicrobia bacterium]|nr:acetylglutamate kinase [Verrucomicrobiota bacterium]
MERIIEKARVLIDAMPYIQRFRGETVVVKFGGSIMEDKQAISDILKDVAFMAAVGMRPVIVHGGGKAISRMMAAKGIEAKFVNGLRVTDEASVQVVEQVLNQEINAELVAVLESHDCTAWGVHGDDLIKVRKKTGTDPETGEVLDWGYVGDVVDVDVAPLTAFLGNSMTPVVTPLGRGEDKKVYNVNADEAAAAIAEKLRARKLVFLSDVPGLLEDMNDPSSRISTVKVSEVDDYIKKGVISGGMLPKIGGGVTALKAGVKKTHIIDAGMPHSLLLELFTDEGVGTQIIN